MRSDVSAAKEKIGPNAPTSACRRRSGAPRAVRQRECADCRVASDVPPIAGHRVRSSAVAAVSAPASFSSSGPVIRFELPPARATYDESWVRSVLTTGSKSSTLQTDISARLECERQQVRCRHVAGWKPPRTIRQRSDWLRSPNHLGLKTKTSASWFRSRTHELAAVIDGAVCVQLLYLAQINPVSYHGRDYRATPSSRVTGMYWLREIGDVIRAIVSVIALLLAWSLITIAMVALLGFWPIVLMAAAGVLLALAKWAAGVGIDRPPRNPPALVRAQMRHQVESFARFLHGPDLRITGAAAFGATVALLGSLRWCWRSLASHAVSGRGL